MYLAKLLAIIPIFVSALEYHGYLKLYPISQFSTALSQQSIQGGIRQSLGGWIDSIHWDLAYELSPSAYFPSIPAMTRETFSDDKLPYRIADFSQMIYPDSVKDIHRSALKQNLDLLSISLKREKFSLTLGRQTVGWGVSRTINPTDVLTPLGFGDIFKEERRGIDAIVFRRSLGMGELETGLVGGSKVTRGENAGFVRAKGSLALGDISAVSVYFRENVLIGGDWEGAIRNCGVRVESAVVMTDVIEQVDRETYVRATAGIDRVFSENVQLFGEYHFNGVGKNGGKMPTNSIAYSEGNVRLVGKHYLISGGAHQLHPLVNLSETIMTELSTGETVVHLTATGNLPRDERFSFDLGAILDISEESVGKTIYGGLRFYW